MKKIGTLAGFQSDCGRCGHRTRIVRSIAPAYAMGGGEDIYGGRCAACSTILWAQDSFHSILIQLNANPPAGMDRKSHRAAIVDAFLASLPQCPVCGGQKFEEFVGSEIPEKPACENCGSESSRFRGYVGEMLNDNVYLFHESEEAERKSKEMRYSFVHWDRLI